MTLGLGQLDEFEGTVRVAAREAPADAGQEDLGIGEVAASQLGDGLRCGDVIAAAGRQLEAALIESLFQPQQIGVRRRVGLDLQHHQECAVDLCVPVEGADAFGKEGERAVLALTTG